MMTRYCWVINLCLAPRECNRHGTFRRPLRRLDSVGGQTADRVSTPLVPGRGGHGTLWRERPPSRTTLRLGTRHGREGIAREASRGTLPGGLRRARPAAVRTEGPATRRGDPRDRGTPYA